MPESQRSSAEAGRRYVVVMEVIAMKRFHVLKVSLVAFVLLLATTSNSYALVNGDIDNDGVVRMDDALLVMRYVAGTTVCNNFLLNIAIDCSYLVFACSAVQREINPTHYGCDITDAVLVLGRSTGHF
jgi:hypothetical protein